jgi:hypothetical protein
LAADDCAVATATMVTAARRKVILAILLDVENAVGLEKI